MAWLVHRQPQQADVAPEAPGPKLPAEADIEAALPALQALIVRVPCAGCGGAHEMTCAEVVVRQLIRGSGWDSEECDGTVTLGTVLSLEDVTACNGDGEAIRALLERRGYLQSPSAAPVTCHSRERHHVLLAH